MAWIESHQSLRDHPKLFRLSRDLGIEPVAAIGHLHCLWWWALDYAKDGNFSDLNGVEISRAAHWPGDTKLFVNAMIAAHFVDRGARGSLVLHDWDDYRLFYHDADRRREAKRAAVRERVQRFRATKKSGNANVTSNNGVTSTTVTPKSPAKKPNLNNQTKLKKPNQAEPSVGKNGNNAHMPPWEIFAITDELRAWCRMKKLPDPDLHLEEFQIHFRKTGGKTSKGQTVKDWSAAFQQWMLRTPEFKTGKNGKETFSADTTQRWLEHG
jgi:hypothetical protein